MTDLFCFLACYQSPPKKTNKQKKKFFLCLFHSHKLRDSCLGFNVVESMKNVFPNSVLSHRNISDVFAENMSFDLKVWQRSALSDVSMLNTVHISTQVKGCGEATSMGR